MKFANLEIPHQVSEISLISKCKECASRILSHNTHLTRDLVDDIFKLWHDPAIQLAYSQAIQYKSFSYQFSQLSVSLSAK